MRRGPVTFDSTIVPDAAHCRSCKLLGGWWRRLWFDQQVLQGLHSACPHLLVMHRDLLLKLVLHCHCCTATAALPLLLLVLLQSCAARRVAPKSPMTGVTMQAQLVPNYNLRSLIREWQERQ